MPTIQVRTDDRTKAASAALFEQLGITMSDAINLFLRQSIMRGGIPFPLTVPDRHKTGIGILENEALIDALKRYKTITGKADFDVTKTEPFIRAVEAVDAIQGTRMTLQEQAVKVRLNYKGRDFVLDYNFEEPDNVFILSSNGGKLAVKDCKLAEISATLECF